jgi:hypothetical protein
MSVQKRSLPPTRGYYRRTDPDHECAGHLKPAASPGKYECRVCGSIHKPQHWRDESGGARP